MLSWLDPSEPHNAEAGCIVSCTTASSSLRSVSRSICFRSPPLNALDAASRVVVSAVEAPVNNVHDTLPSP
jgi:hypothetical protein